MSKRIPKKINQEFFKEWSPNMAYVLGFFVADGCLAISKGRKSNPYTFTITSKDIELLYKIKKALGSEYKISKKSGSSNSVAYQIQFRNLVIVNDLMNIGIYPRKTYHLDPVRIPKEYFPDFVRGFFDGDGSVYIYTVNNVSQIKSSFVSTSLDFIVDFNRNLCRALNIPEKSIHQVKGRKEGMMIQYNTCFYIDDSEKLSKFMYGGGSPLYLKRKKKIFHKWMAMQRRKFTKRNYPSKIGWHLNEGIKVS